VPVIALSQLSRAVEQRGAKDRRPQLSDLRESGSIEQDADLVMFLYREEYYDRDETDDSNKGVAEVIVAKHRNGPTGDFKVAFISKYAKFASLAH
jgi:replicative DNA helicase